MVYYTAKRNLLPSSPNDYYREHMQALIDSQWDNTTMLYTIEEESPFASFEFKEIQVHFSDTLAGVRFHNGVSFLSRFLIYYIPTNVVCQAGESLFIISSARSPSCYP